MDEPSTLSPQDRALLRLIEADLDSGKLVDGPLPATRNLPWTCGIVLSVAGPSLAALLLLFGPPDGIALAWAVVSALVASMAMTFHRVTPAFRAVLRRTGWRTASLFRQPARMLRRRRRDHR